MYLSICHCTSLLRKWLYFQTSEHPIWVTCKGKLSLCLTNRALRHEGVWGSGCGCGLDDREVGFRLTVGSRIFTSPCRPDRLWGPPNLLHNGYRGPGVKRPGREADHSHQTSAEVKKMWIYIWATYDTITRARARARMSTRLSHRMILSFLIMLNAENVHIAMSLLVGAHTVAEQPNDSLGSLVALHF
jgi:hypothetical protein